MFNLSISQFEKIIKHFIHSPKNKKFVNDKPVLTNGDVFCPMCDEYHVNNVFCQL